MIKTAFVRVKKIKGNPYGYLVENEWTPWGSRQRVTKYLGKAVTLQRLSEQSSQLPTGMQQAIITAVKQELTNHGFVEKNANYANDQDVHVNLTEKTVRHKGRNIVLGMNEGYLCGHTLQQLLSYTPLERPNESATKLANLALEAGLKLNDEQFVHLFEQAKQ